MAFIAIPTLAGQAAIAAALDPSSPAPLAISEMVVGDGGGSPTAPVETQTGLVNQRAIVPVSQTSRAANKLTIDGLLDETIGGFTIREAGILDEDGVLLFVASIPETEKVLVTQGGVQDVLTLGLVVVVSDTAQVLITVDGLTYATHDYVNQTVAGIRTNVATPMRPYHIAVRSMALASPPSSPTPGDAYIVSADATGAWAGQSGRLAQYVGASSWVFATCPLGHLVGNESDGLLYHRVASGWVPVLPASAPTGGWLHQSPAGLRSWTDPFNINSLTERPIANGDFLPFHDVSVGGKSKCTTESFAQLVTDNTSLEVFFIGMM